MRSQAERDAAVRVWLDERNLLKPNDVHNATFFERNPDAAPKALNLLIEAQKKLMKLEDEFAVISARRDQSLRTMGIHLSWIHWRGNLPTAVSRVTDIIMISTTSRTICKCSQCANELTFGVKLTAALCCNFRVLCKVSREAPLLGSSIARTAVASLSGSGMGGCLNINILRQARLS